MLPTLPSFQTPEAGGLNSVYAFARRGPSAPTQMDALAESVMRARANPQLFVYDPIAGTVFSPRGGLSRSTFSDRNRRFIDVRDYGAKCDCTIDPTTGVISGTDDSNAILAAIADMPTPTVTGGTCGATIFIPGLCRCLSLITGIQPYTRFLGIGGWALITAYIPPCGLVYDPAITHLGGDFLDFGSNQGCAIEDLSVLIGESSGSAINVEAGLQLRNVKVHCTTGSFDGAIPTSAMGTGIQASNPQSGIMLDRVYVTGFNIGADFAGTQALWMHQSFFSLNNYACRIGNTQGTSGSIVSSAFQDSITGDIDLINCAPMGFYGCYFEYGDWIGASPNPHPWMMRLGHGAGNKAYGVGLYNTHVVGNVDASAKMMIWERCASLRIETLWLGSGYRNPVIDNAGPDVSDVHLQHFVLADVPHDVLSDFTGVVFDDFSGFPKFRTGFLELVTRSLTVNLLTKPASYFNGSVANVFNIAAGNWQGESTEDFPGAGWKWINERPGGYDVGLPFYMATSTGVIKKVGTIFWIGTAAWTNGNLATQVGDAVITTRNATGEFIVIRGRSDGKVLLNEAILMPAADGTAGQRLRTPGSGGTQVWTNDGEPANSPAQIAAQKDNYAPGASAFQRWNSDASRDVTGMVAGIDGERRRVWNIGSFNIVFKHNSASSSAGNKFACNTGADITLAPNYRVDTEYDTTSGVWRVTQ